MFLPDVCGKIFWSKAGMDDPCSCEYWTNGASAFFEYWIPCRIRGTSILALPVFLLPCPCAKKKYGMKNHKNFQNWEFRPTWIAIWISSSERYWHFFPQSGQRWPSVPPEGWCILLMWPFNDSTSITFWGSKDLFKPKVMIISLTLLACKHSTQQAPSTGWAILKCGLRWRLLGTDSLQTGHVTETSRFNLKYDSIMKNTF